MATKHNLQLNPWPAFPSSSVMGCMDPASLPEVPAPPLADPTQQKDTASPSFPKLPVQPQSRSLPLSFHLSASHLHLPDSWGPSKLFRQHPQPPAWEPRSLPVCTLGQGRAPKPQRGLRGLLAAQSQAGSWSGLLKAMLASVQGGVRARRGPCLGKLTGCLCPRSRVGAGIRGFPSQAQPG